MARKFFDRFRLQTAKKFRPQREGQPFTAGQSPEQPNLVSGYQETKPRSGSTTRVVEPGLEINVTDDVPIPHDQEPTQGQRKDIFWRWSLLWLSLLLICGGTGAVAILWLATVPPPPNCQQISPLAADAERLYCAQQSAQSGKLEALVAGVQLVSNWPSAHPLYPEGQRFMEQWSKSILAIAGQKINQSDLKGAIATANKIPKTSPLYSEAQAAIATWKKNWDQGQVIYDKAQAAIKAQAWDQASEQVKALSKLDNDYWRQKRLNELIQQIATEKVARQQLKQARELAKNDTSEQLGEAIALAQKIGPKSYARSDAQTEISRWSRALLNIAQKALAQKDLEGAIAAATRVPQESYLAAEAQDWIQLGRAQAATWPNESMSKPLYEQIWGYMEALALARKLSPERPLYKKAQALIADWQAQQQDLIQLELASASASIGQRLTFQFAIDQAQMIGSDRPRRVHAQTLIANWQNEIERIEDRPYIEFARQLAKSGTIDSLNTAIDEASQVKQGRALRLQAQTLIAQWNQQIRILEDQVFLDRARSLADKGDLGAAIQAAELIVPDRPLYGEAQAAIRDWTAQIQITEDRPILNEATALANQGSLSAAIEVASRIGRGRALYYEAQDAISRWAVERDAILNPPAVQPEQQDYSEEYSEDDSEPEPQPSEVLPQPPTESLPPDQVAPPPSVNEPPPPPPAVP
jgi:hypothetical protein